MSSIPQEIEADQVHHLPIVKAYADKIGLVEMVNQLVPTEMAVDPGTIVLGMILETLSGRSPLYRWQDFVAQHDTALRLGKAVPAEAFNDDTVGRVLDRLYDTGTSQLFTACAVRADRVFGWEKRSVHVDTTSGRVYGDDRRPEEPEDQEVPLTMTYGDSQDKRPDLKPCVLATRCVDRAVPLWGQPEDGNVSEKTVNTTILAEITHVLAHPGVKPGAYLDVADAAVVTEDHLAALGATLCISRLPATSNACGRVIAEAVAQDRWEAVGIRADTKPTPHRPAASSKVAEGTVTLSGQPYRAVVVQSSTPDQRRLKRLERDVQASQTTLQDTVRAAQKHEYVCRAEAEAAAKTRRAMQSAYHQVEGTGEARPKDGKGRPSTRKPRPVQEMRSGLKAVVTERAALMARERDAADGFVFLTHGPTEGSLAHRAEEVLPAQKDQHGIEQNFAFVKDPLMVNSLFLKTPERSDALGLVVLLALLLGRLMARQMRAPVETTGTPLPGWDQQVTERPTAFMMMTKFAGVLMRKVGLPRQLARPLSAMPQQYLVALRGSPTGLTIPAG